MQMLAVVIAAVAGFYLAMSIVLFGRRTPGYQHVRDTISELGEIGAVHQRSVAYGVFLPVGLLALASAGLLYAASQAAAGLAACIAVGYIGAALFPCDPGSPVSGSARQGVHNLAGSIEYIGGGAAFLSLSHAQGDLYRLLGFVAIGAAVLITVLPSTSFRGLVQRVAEVCLFGGLVAVAGTLYGGA